MMRWMLALGLALVAGLSAGRADTHFFRQDRLKLSSKTYVNLVVISDCDFAEIKNSTFLGGLRIIGSDYVTIDNCRIAGTSQNGALYIAPGHPWAWAETAAESGYSWKEGQQWMEGENRAAFIGRLGQKRDLVLSREPGRIVFDLSGLGKTDWLQDYSTNVWLVEGKPARFVSIEGDSASSAAVFPIGARVTLAVDFTPGANPDWFTYDPAALVRGTVVRDCVFENPSGSGVSVYWSVGTVIEGCRAIGCKDYGVGLEFAFGGRMSGNVCVMDQVYPNFPLGYHGLEVVGHAEQVTVEGNIGVLGLVPHGCRQGVTAR